MASKPRALVLGHSFLRRVVEFIDLHQANDNYRRDLNLSEVCDVESFGVGGRTVDKMIRLDLEVIKGTPPMSWFWRSARMIFATVIAMRTRLRFTELLIKSLSLPLVVVCQILPRMHTPFDGYNERVQKVDTLLQLQNVNSAKFWRHRGLVNPDKNVYARDGIHLNDFGNEALYRSYSGAILFTLSQFH